MRAALFIVMLAAFPALSLFAEDASVAVGHVPVAGAQDTGLADLAGAQVRQLDHAIDRVLDQPDYAWRFPRTFTLLTEEERSSFVFTFLYEVGSRLKRMAESIGRFMKKIKDWFYRMLPKSHYNEGTSSGWQTSIQTLFFVFLAVTACVLAVMLWRYLRHRRRQAPIVVAQPVVQAVDLLHEDVDADRLPSDEWMKLARELLDKGELRLALRAMFLAGLAYLGHEQLLTVRRGKSNRDYQRELERRAHDSPDLLVAFTRNTGRLERSWYGRHEVTPDDLSTFLADQSVIMPGVTGVDRSVVTSRAADATSGPEGDVQ